MEKLAKLAPLLDEITPFRLSLGMAGLCLIIMSVTTCNTLSIDGPLPPPRKPPPPIEQTAVLSDRFKEGFYRGQVDDDCKAVGIRQLGLDTLKQPNPHNVEYTGGQRLKVGKKLETKSLLLKAISKRMQIGEAGQGIRVAHLTLKITNKTDTFLAYRVITSVGGGQRTKAELGHNAIALKPRETLYRTEGLLREASTVRIKRVEVLELTHLGYHYVSRLDPIRLQYDKRTASGHAYKGLNTCHLLPWREIRAGYRVHAVDWRDVMDFYARHSCSEYTFFRGYRWSKQALKKLPLRKQKNK